MCFRRLLFVRVEIGELQIVPVLLSKTLLFVGQLYANKSLALGVRDLLFLATDLQIVNY